MFIKKKTFELLKGSLEREIAENVRLSAKPKTGVSLGDLGEALKAPPTAVTPTAPRTISDETTLMSDQIVGFRRVKRADCDPADEDVLYVYLANGQRFAFYGADARSVLDDAALTESMKKRGQITYFGFRSTPNL